MQIKATRNTLLVLLILAFPIFVFSNFSSEKINFKNFPPKEINTPYSSALMLTLDVLTLDVSCFGGSTGNAVAQPANGMEPYSYAWSNGDTTTTSSNLPIGIYSLIVTDATGATASKDFTINQPDALVAMAISTIGCDGGNSGMVMGNASGGVFPYSYAWSTGDSTQTSTGLSTGTYFLTVTDFLGCVAMTSVNLDQPIAVQSNPQATMTSCQTASDGSITLDVWGGSESFTFLWSNDSTTQNISGLSAGDYTVTVTDSNGCTSESSKTIFNPSPINMNIQGISNVSCHGGADGAVLADAFGGNPGYTYTWSNGDTGTFADSLTVGVYFVTITDAVGCTGTGIANINEPPPLGVFLYTSPVCNGSNDGTATASVSGGTPVFQYAWSDGQNTMIATNLTIGTYTVTITDAGNCVTVDSIEITQNPTIFESNGISEMVACPQEATGMASVTPSGAIAPYTYVWNTGSTDSVLTGLVPGNYTVTIYDFFNCTVTESFSITQPDNLDANPIITPASCGLNNGKIKIAPTGSTSPYTYEWTDGSTADSLDNLGLGTYSVIVTDANNCVRQFYYEITPFNSAPLAQAQDLTIYLDATGQATIDVAQINNGSSDNCSIDSMYIDISNFDCSNVGENTVILTVQDEENLTSTSTAMVTIIDETPANIITQNMTVYLDGSGMASVDANQIDNGSSDNCGIESMNLDISQFTCDNLGDNTVTLTINDVNGNSTFAPAMVTVLDTLAPIVTTQQVTVYLDAAGMVSVDASQVDNGSADNCGIESMNLDITQFTCDNLGDNMVVLTMEDVNGNSASASATIVVVDSSVSSVMTQEVTVYLDASGMASIDANQVDNGSSDNCGIDSMSLNITQFTCANVGDNTVVLTVNDVNGNSISAPALVTVLDTIAPVLTCPINPPSFFACDGTNFIADYQLPTATDNCTTGLIPTLTGGVAPGDILPAGMTTITYESMDASGNTATCSFEITLDVSDPISVQLDDFVPATDGENNGSVSITVSGIGPYTFSWADSANVVVGTTEDLMNVPAGDYCVTVTDMNGCETIYCTEIPTGIQDPELVQQVYVFPNPTSDILRVNIDFSIGENDRIQLYTLGGKLVLEKNLQVGEQQIELNLNDYPKGIYTLQLTVDQGVVTKKVILQE